VGQGGVQVGDMHPDQAGDVGGAGGLAQLPGPHRGAGIAPQVGGHASPRRCSQLGRVDPGRGGGPEPARFLDELTVRMPTADETRALRLPPATPVASLLRTYRDRAGKPFEVAQSVLAGDKHILVYEGQLSTSA
jgi:hypothetical protein